MDPFKMDPWKSVKSMEIRTNKQINEINENGPLKWTLGKWTLEMDPRDGPLEMDPWKWTLGNGPLGISEIHGNQDKQRNQRNQ